MMKQYQRLKAAHPDAILFFRLGDFYEMFLGDAEVGARELEITLTSRTTGAGGRVPMCGVPYHAAEAYLSRLVEKGYKVAVCDQVEDPRQAAGLVRREVVRVVTPGTLLDPAALPEKAGNYTVAIAARQRVYGLAVLDYSTGEFRTAEFGGAAGLGRLADELACLEPAEAIVQPTAGEDPDLRRVLERALRRPAAPYAEQAFRPDRAAETLLGHFRAVSLESYGCADKPLAVAAAGALLAYLRETGVGTLDHIRAIRTDAGGEVMTLDAATRRNLELVEPLRPGAGPGLGQGGTGRVRPGTLLAVLDHTVTSAGGRLLRSWLVHPLTGLEAVAARQTAVAELVQRHLAHEELRTELRRIYDLERLVTRAAAGTAGARDLLALRDSLATVPAIQAALEGASAPLLGALARRLDPVTEVGDLIRTALADNPPVGLRDGGLIRPGYSPEADELREAATGGKAWVAGLEADERRRTGIRSLKVGFNQVFGYYIEITRPNLGAVPDGYERRQTLANAERFITPELKEREVIILGAEERLANVEYGIFCTVRERAAAEAARIQATAGAVAILDCLLALAEAARRYGYTAPALSAEPGIVIKGGRHPVVERLQSAEEFVANDCTLGGPDPAFAIITGPNMAGKSTYCRQVALIVLMAQIGSLVPAAEARIGLVDRIFTRIGASDELSGGRSTFLVEMSETANILHHASRRSLIILDEIGRGTSTYDGLSLAWAVAEHIAAGLGSLTLFATHYHELTELESRLPGVVNYCISVREMGEDIVFLRKVARGAVDRSYGIQVARLAGLPAPVISRAREILHELETAAANGARSEVAATAGATVAATAPSPSRPASQLVLFEAPRSEVEQDISDLDLVNLTPLDALTRLYGYQERIRKGRG